MKLPDSEVPSFEYREVVIGERVGNSYTVMEGLKKGDEVVTNGAFVIDAAAQLNNQSSMMNQNLTNKVTDASEDTTPDFSGQTNESFQLQLNNLLLSYYQLKDALVNDEAKSSREKARRLLESLNNVDMRLIKGDAHKYWMLQLEKIKSNGKKIAATEKIEEQRNAFIPLSNGMINSIKAFGTKSKVYVQFCPMADDNNGGYWLSESPEIRNPYFGASMLECGEVKSKIE